MLTYPQNSGTDFEYWGVAGPFPSSRGTYHYSSHTHKRYRDYLDNGDNGPMVQMKVTEMDMLMAEALLRTGGSAGAVADLINKTRVERAQLEPATAGTPAGSPDHGPRYVGPEDGSETIIANEQRDNSGAHVAGTVLTYPQNSGTDFEYWGVAGPFPSSRGTYHYSSHTHKRYRDYLDNGDNGPMVQMKVTEMDMLMAEALLRTGGSAGAVADLINKTRVERAQLEPATAGTPAGSPDHGPNDLTYKPTQAGATLWDMLKYEKNIDCYVAGSGRAWFDKRGWGDLITGTLLHFPVPGAELEVLQLQIYTFGGVGGPGSAPKRGQSYDRSEAKTARVK